MTPRNAAISLAAATALATTGLVVAQGATAAPAASKKLSCVASSSPRYPSQYSYLHINVTAKIGGKAAKNDAVKTVAHYASTNTTHHGRTSSKGVASIEYYISDAGKGHKVGVSVTVAGTHKSAACSTSFTPS